MGPKKGSFLSPCVIYGQKSQLFGYLNLQNSFPKQKVYRKLNDQGLSAFPFALLAFSDSSNGSGLTSRLSISKGIKREIKVNEKRLRSAYAVPACMGLNLSIRFVLHTKIAVENQTIFPDKSKKKRMATLLKKWSKRYSEKTIKVSLFRVK